MNLLWITDPHLNFLPQGGAQTLGDYLCQEESVDAVIISGDIAEAPSLRDVLTEFARGVAPRPVYFVLGNHDYYGGSFSLVQADLREGFSETNLVWLDDAGVTLLDADTALVGHQGWFDARLGDPEGSRVHMADFELIAELRQRFLHESNWIQPGRPALVAELRALGTRAAAAAKPALTEALRLRHTVIFATHFPPFEDSCWHQGSISDKHWLPWFTCKAMGEMLSDVAREHPQNRILVLCGHTHSPGSYDHTPNLRVLTGKSTYGAPDVSAVLRTPIEEW